jgi:hypothetical protein
MLFFAGLITIIMGITCIVNPEFAWYVYELDHHVMGQTVNQPKKWRSYVNAAGYILIAVGATCVKMAVMLIL